MSPALILIAGFSVVPWGKLQVQKMVRFAV